MANDEAPPERLRGKLSRTELKKRGSVLRTPQAKGAPQEDDPSWYVLEGLLFYWLTLGPEIAEKRIERLVRHLGGDQGMIGAVFGLVEHYAELMRPGSVLPDLIDSWDKKKTESERMKATRRLAQKIGNPVYEERWLQYEKDILHRLMERHERDGKISLKKALEDENSTILQSPTERTTEDDLYEKAFAEDDRIPSWIDYVQELPVTQRETLIRLKRDIERVLLNDLLGSKYRSEYKTVSIDSPLDREEKDGETLVDTIPGEEEDSDPEEAAFTGEISEKINKLMKQARLSKMEGQIFQLIYEGRTPKDIATILKTTENSVRVSLSNARAKIIGKFGERALRSMMEND